MVEKTGISVKIMRDSGMVHNYKVRNCSNCKFEGKNYECTHPKEHTPSFAKIEMSECWEHDKRASVSVKMSNKSKERNTYEKK